MSNNRVRVGSNDRVRIRLDEDVAYVVRVGGSSVVNIACGGARDAPGPRAGTGSLGAGVTGFAGTLEEKRKARCCLFRQT